MAWIILIVAILVIAASISIKIFKLALKIVLASGFIILALTFFYR